MVWKLDFLDKENYYENLYWHTNKKFLHEDYDLVGEIFRTNKTKENFVTSIVDKFGNCKRNLKHFMDICQIQYNNIDNEIHRETPNEECLPKFSFWWNNRPKTGDKMNCDDLPVICDNILYKYDKKEIIFYENKKTKKQYRREPKDYTSKKYRKFTDVPEPRKTALKKLNNYLN